MVRNIELAVAFGDSKSPRVLSLPARVGEQLGNRGRNNAYNIRDGHGKCKIQVCLNGRSEGPRKQECW
jgi:hypothetical protein